MTPNGPRTNEPAHGKKIHWEAYSFENEIRARRFRESKNQRTKNVKIYKKLRMAS